MDIEGFYSQDERRRMSEEIEFGTEWRDANGNRYELSWVVDTGELYVMLEPTVGGLIEDPFGDVFDVGHARADQLTVAVVGWIPDRARVDEVLSRMGVGDGCRERDHMACGSPEAGRCATSTPTA